MSRVVKIVSIGAAVQDVFLRGRIFEPQRDEGELVEEFTLGTKNDIEAMTISTGGGATNASVTFARNDLNSYFMGRIGKDIPGRFILEELHHDNINTSLVGYNASKGTGYSTLLLSPNGERTILTYRGASTNFGYKASDFFNTVPDWFYVSSLSGDIKSLQAIVMYARKNNIKIAINPGKDELKQKTEFKKLLTDFAILSLNKQEAQMIFDGNTSEELVRHACNHVGIMLITDGPKGSIVCDGKQIYKAGMYEDVPVIDRTGAGDAFSSGFVAKMVSGGTVEEALTFASANSTSVVQQIGAKAGILESGTKLKKMDIKVRDL